MFDRIEENSLDQWGETGLRLSNDLLMREISKQSNQSNGHFKADLSYEQMHSCFGDF
jgi:hypothetical protein